MILTLKLLTCLEKKASVCANKLTNIVLIYVSSSLDIPVYS